MPPHEHHTCWKKQWKNHFPVLRLKQLRRKKNIHLKHFLKLQRKALFSQDPKTTACLDIVVDMLMKKYDVADDSIMEFCDIVGDYEAMVLEKSTHYPTAEQYRLFHTVFPAASAIVIGRFGIFPLADKLEDKKKEKKEKKDVVGGGESADSDSDSDNDE